MVVTQLMRDRLRRSFFVLLSFFACYVIFINIYGSWYAPAPQTKLDRLQTNLVLQAITDDRVRRILGPQGIEGFYHTALNEYLQVEDQSQVIPELGLLYIQNDQGQAAFDLWQQQNELCQTLANLWRSEPSVSENSEELIKQNLSGWFESFALSRYYQIARPQALPGFELQQTIEAEEAVFRLFLINLIPIGGSLVGGIILLVYLFKLRKTDRLEWQTPWNLETLWQVLVSWFCAYTLIAQFLPRILSFLTNQSVIIATTYFASMVPMVGILALSLRNYKGWPKIIFNFPQINANCLLWTIGGYIAAVPLIVIISLIQQSILQGHGGGNPLLEIISQRQNNWSIFMFWVTVGIYAPLFEEILFRGFLFPTLTKYISLQMSLGVSAFLFALVHMNVNDLIPLTILGIVLAIVYDRSRSLFTPILLHSLWNTGSFVSLLLVSSNHII